MALSELLLQLKGERGALPGLYSDSLQEVLVVVPARQDKGLVSSSDMKATAK